MNNPRLEQLLEFLKEDPNDTFTLYALALEYEKSDENKALLYYDQLLRDHEEYTATYYHAGKLYERTGKKDIAEQIYKKGMEICLKQNKRHALNELRGAYNSLMDEDE